MNDCRVGWIVSGGGLTMRTYYALGGRVDCVVSDRYCGAIEWASTSSAVAWVSCEVTHDGKRMLHPLNWHGPVDVWICAYNRLLTKRQIAEAGAPIINVHPSLLPRYPGLHAVDRALDAGERRVGATVHIVDDGMDTGRVLEQAAIDVAPDEDRRSVAEDVLRLGALLALRAVRRRAWR